MAEREFSEITLAARHFPDYSVEPDETGSKHKRELPGKVQIGFLVEGVFVPAVERKAAGLFADIERHQKQRDAGEPSQDG